MLRLQNLVSLAVNKWTFHEKIPTWVKEYIIVCAKIPYNRMHYLSKPGLVIRIIGIIDSFLGLLNEMSWLIHGIPAVIQNVVLELSVFTGGCHAPYCLGQCLESIGRVTCSHTGVTLISLRISNENNKQYVRWLKKIWKVGRTFKCHRHFTITFSCLCGHWTYLML